VAIAMGLGRQVTFWIAACVVIILLMWLLRGILLPFVAGMALAYLFNPLANRLERLGIGRLIASLAIIGLFVLAFIVLILLIAPVIGAQLAAFIENLPTYVRKLQAVLADPSRPWLQRLLGDTVTGTDASLGELVKQGASWLAAFMTSLWSGGQALISIFSLVVVTPVVAFYLLYDWDRMIAKVDGWVPLPYRETVREIGREIDRAIAGFVRGQTGVCLILGSFYAVGLTLVGLNFGLLIGLVSGLITFIPYVGSMTGLVLSVGVAVAQFWPNWWPIMLVIGIFFAGQFLEGYILQPKLVGESVGLHPVWLMFALFAFGYLFGFVGMLIAVPLAAAIGVIVRFALGRYLESALYTGEQGLSPTNSTSRSTKKAG
jgi:predicted PurR-regulated permease PerM